MPTNFSVTESTVTSIRIACQDGKQEVGHAFLLLGHNELHEQPFGYLEDVFIAESDRGKGLGTQLIERVIQEAKDRGCYKLICTSRVEREKVHALYERLGFTKHGFEFRIDLTD